MRKESYVYCHRRKDNGHIFYIGVGSNFKENIKKSRSTTTVGRNKDWHAVVNDAGGFTTDILIEGISRGEAFEIESLLIEMFSNDSLVNKSKSHMTASIDFDTLSSLLYVCPDSPTGLRWKVDRNTKTKAGMVAGYRHGNYYRIEVNHQSYMVHRVIWVLAHNDSDMIDFAINHKDCNGLNNSIDNLEKCTNWENNVKQKAHVYNKCRSNNTTGASGVVTTSTPDGYSYYLAIWQENGVRKHKSFGIRKYGEAEAFRLACAWRKSMEEKHYN